MRPRRTFEKLVRGPANSVPQFRANTPVAKRCSTASSSACKLFESDSEEDDELLFVLNLSRRESGRPASVSRVGSSNGAGSVSETGGSVIQQSTAVSAIGNMKRGEMIVGDGEMESNFRGGDVGLEGVLLKEDECASSDGDSVIFLRETRNSAEVIDLTIDDDSFPVVDAVPVSDTLWVLPSARFLNPCVTLTLMFWVGGKNITNVSDHYYVCVCARWSRELKLNDHKAIINKRTHLDTQEELWRHDGDGWIRVFWQHPFPIGNAGIVVIKTKGAVVDVVF